MRTPPWEHGEAQQRARAAAVAAAADVLADVVSDVTKGRDSTMPRGDKVLLFLFLIAISLAYCSSGECHRWLQLECREVQDGTGS